MDLGKRLSEMVDAFCSDKGIVGCICELGIQVKIHTITDCVYFYLTRN